MKRGVAVVAVVWLVAYASAVSADWVGVYRMSDEKHKDIGTLTVKYRDAQHVRYDYKGKSVDEPGGGMLLVKDKLYGVSPSGEVVDMEGVTALVKSLAPTDQAQAVSKFSLESTGKKERIAGFEGEVYRWKDGAQQGELVLTKDHAVRKLTEAIERVGDKMQQGMGGAEAMRLSVVRENPVLREQGMLRSHEVASGGMRLESVQEVALADSVFALPKGAKTRTMPNLNDPQMQKMMQEMMKQQGGR